MRISTRLAAFGGAAALVAALAVPTISTTPASAAPTEFKGVGGNMTAGGALDAFNAFRAALGGANNGANPLSTPVTTGRREINWDGVHLTLPDGTFDTQVIDSGKTVAIPVNRFQERGALFAERYAVSGDGFHSVSGATAFPSFSPSNTFAMFNDNTIEMSFVQPSLHTVVEPVPAAVTGFGAIFVGVQTDNTSSIEYFHGTQSLGKFYVPKSSGAGDFEFLGEVFPTATVTGVELTLGNATLFNFNGSTFSAGTPESLPTTDLAVTDDFAYGEPQCTRTLGAVSSPTLLAANGDILCLNGTTVNGSVVGQPGSVVVVNNAFVAGNIQATGASYLLVCGSTVRGAISSDMAAGPVQIGDVGNDDGLNCTANNVRGQVAVTNGKDTFEVGGNQIGGNLSAIGNGFRIVQLGTQASAEYIPELEGNTVGGSLTCVNNSPIPVSDNHPNIVVGSTTNCLIDPPVVN